MQGIPGVRFLAETTDKNEKDWENKCKARTRAKVEHLRIQDMMESYLKSVGVYLKVPTMPETVTLVVKKNKPSEEENV